MSFNPGAYAREMKYVWRQRERVIFLLLTLFSSCVSDKPTISSAFEREWIDYMTQNEYDSQRAVKHLFISIDPSGARERNLYVLTSMAFIDGTCVVCLISNHRLITSFTISIIEGETRSPPRKSST